ncbi:MAG: hypothetical protein IJR66_02100 [Clostridia bacterium]|nr:hypothetical protein [Clostridia bacterium]
MEICFVKNRSLYNFWNESLEEAVGKDVLVFGAKGLGLISYKKELEAETEYFQDVAKLSKQLKNVIVSGCDTDTYGVYRHSVVVADCGRVLGVSDMCHVLDESEFVSGGNYRVYDTSKGRIGIIVGDDLYFFESSRVLSLCDADYIFCIIKKTTNAIAQIMQRACSFSNGVSISLLTENYVSVADIRGNVCFFSSKDISSYKLKIEKEYRQITARRKGITDEII